MARAFIRSAIYLDSDFASDIVPVLRIAPALAFVVVVEVEVFVVLIDSPRYVAGA